MYVCKLHWAWMDRFMTLLHCILIYGECAFTLAEAMSTVAIGTFAWVSIWACSLTGNNMLQKCVYILIGGDPSINPALKVVKTDEWKVRTQSAVKGIQQCWAASCSSIQFDLRLSPTINPLITALMSQSVLCWAKDKHKSSQIWGL